MNFKELQNIKLEYRTLFDQVVDEFYIPVLNKARLYKRAVGYFSSNILVQITKGLCSMIKNNGKIQLLISPTLDKEDYEAIKNGYKNRVQEYLDDKLNKMFVEEDDIDSKNRYALLSYLIEINLLEIKVVILEEGNNNAIYHEKLGIMKDDYNNVIAFSGSANETYNGYNLNYEAIDVFCSWKSLESENRTFIKEMAFDNLWKGKEKGTIVLNFPEIIKKRLLAYKTLSKENLMVIDENFQIELNKNKRKPNIPSYKGHVKLHDYQEEAIESWENNNFRGIFDMATGTGKTYTGAAGICRLFEVKNRLFCVIVCPYVHLIDQWEEELKVFNIDALKCYGNRSSYQKKLQKLVLKFHQRRITFGCILTTNRTFIGDNIQEVIFENLSDTLLLVDEAHNFGAGKISKTLKTDYPYRLALSATLDRYGDEEGTKKLYDFFGKKCITYSLKRAIEEDKLTKYKYIPIIVNLTEDELEEYLFLTKKIGKYRTKIGQPMPLKLKQLLIKRARLVAGAKNKVDILMNLLKDYKDSNNILIYCGAVIYDDQQEDEALEDKKQIEVVVERMYKQYGFCVAKFTSEENSETREALKNSFKNGDLQALVAIKCLDEGMNIPSIETAFILASSVNPKEYIQRRGRVLRKFPGKKYAVIYDFITLTRPIDNDWSIPVKNRKMERSLAKKELLRLKDFADLSENAYESNEIIDKIVDAYGINLIDDGEDYYE